MASLTIQIFDSDRGESAPVTQSIRFVNQSFIT